MNDPIKARARRLVRYLAEKHQFDLKHSHALEAIAAEEGVRNYHVLSARESHAIASPVTGDSPPSRIEDEADGRFMGRASETDDMTTVALQILAEAKELQASHVRVTYYPGAGDFSVRFHKDRKIMSEPEHTALNPDWVDRLMKAIFNEMCEHPNAEFDPQQAQLVELRSDFCRALDLRKGDVWLSPIGERGRVMLLQIFYNEAEIVTSEIARVVGEAQRSGEQSTLDFHSAVWQQMGELFANRSRLTALVAQRASIPLSPSASLIAHDEAIKALIRVPNPVATVALAWRGSADEEVRHLGEALLKELKKSK